MEIVKSTFNTQTPEGMLQVFNATNGASIPLRNAIGEVLELKDILVYSDEVSGFGGAEPSQAELVAFFTEDGKTYAGVSAVATKSAKNLIDMMSANPNIKPKISFVEGKSNGGQKFVNLQVVSL